MGSKTDGRRAFDVIRLEGDAYVVVAMAGEIDIAAAPYVRHELAAAAELSRPLVVADLETVTFLDASGVAALVHGARRVAERGGLMTLTSPPRTVRRVLEITDLDKHLRVHATIEDAVEWAREISVFASR